MAQKKIINLKDKNYSFINSKNENIKLLIFNTITMSLEIEIYKDKTFIKKDHLVFAHLPKKLKSILNPLK